MLKSQLLAEAQKIETAVVLDGIFESVSLSEEVKANFSTVFEQTVKAKAVELAMSHITEMAEKAEVKLAELVEAAKAENQTELMENADKFLSHIAATWLAENKLAVENGIKSRMCESMISGLKELFVEHNIIVPEESVDVVAELESELDESKAEISSLFDKNVALTEEIANLKREATLKEATRDLTDSQKEKVMGLVEGLNYDDAYSGKLTAIVEMVVASSEKPESNTVNISEAATEAEASNFTAEVEELKEENKPSTSMAQYLNAARRLA